MPSATRRPQQRYDALRYAINNGFVNKNKIDIKFDKNEIVRRHIRNEPSIELELMEWLCRMQRFERKGKGVSTSDELAKASDDAIIDWSIHSMTLRGCYQSKRSIQLESIELQSMECLPVDWRIEKRWGAIGDTKGKFDKSNPTLAICCSSNGVFRIGVNDDGKILKSQ